ncbi:MAG: DUF998 domain-containing protein [Candidatus Bathyarchaeia archaeon]
MDKKICALFGVVGPLVACVSIGVSIALSPWFNWGRNALSDLGHAVKSGVAPIYNFGLLLTGFLIMVYAVTALRGYARRTSCSLTISAFMLQLVAVFDEVYGSIHSIVSVLFFVSLIPTIILYAIERRSFLAVIGFIVGLLSWIFYWVGIYSAGVAVPEAISTIAVIPCLISSALNIYRSK